MSVSLEYCARMGDFKNKFDMLSISSTYPGDTSSNPSTEDGPLVESPTVQTNVIDRFGEADGLGSPFPVTYFDRHDVPFSRKTTNEEYIADPIEAHGRPVCPVPLSVKPDQHLVQRPFPYPAQQQPRMILVGVPILSPPHKSSVMPTLGYAPSLQQPNPLPSSSSSSVLAEAPAPKQQEQKPQPAQQQKQPAQKAVPKNNGNAKSGARSNSHCCLDTMPADKKEKLCKYIYEVMVQKKFTSPNGHLIVDIFTEVWKDMSDTSEGSKVAEQRFCELLRSAPQYFKLFRKSIQVANHCGWYARKGERMVRLVLEDEE